VRVHRRAAVATAVAALLVLLAACSGGGDGGDAAETVRQSPERTAAAGSARVGLSITFSSAGNQGVVSGDGLVDLTNSRGAVTLDLGGLGGTLISGPVDTVLAREGLFVKLPPSLLAGSKPWVKIDLSAVAGAAGVNLGSVGQLQSVDPSQVLHFLKGAADSVKKVGEEQVRDVETTHYRGNLDLNKAAADAPPEVQEAIRQAISGLGTSTIPANVWIDDEGRMRRLRLQTAGESGAPAGTLEFELYDFGVTADVQLPPADQVTDLASSFGGRPR
jgi:hypothetical protein